MAILNRYWSIFAFLICATTSRSTASEPTQNEATENISNSEVWAGVGYGVSYFSFSERENTSKGESSAPNLRLNLGFDYNDSFGLYTSYSQIDTNLNNNAHIGSIGVRGIWKLNDAFTIFSKAGVGVLSGGYHDNGPFGSLGVGLQYRLTRAIELTTGIEYYDHVEFSSDLATNIVQFNIGAQYSFGAQEIDSSHVTSPSIVKVEQPSDQKPKIEAKRPTSELSTPQPTFEPFRHTSLFDTDSIVPKVDMSGWKDVANTVISNPKAKVIVIGHTDSVGHSKYNDALSLKRAQKVSSILSSLGVNPARISVVGKGETEPKSSNITTEGRALNRRVEVLLVEPDMLNSHATENEFSDANIKPEAYLNTSQVNTPFSYCESVFLFSINSSKPKVFPDEFEKLLRSASERPQANIYIDGYTDTTGSLEYNQQLSTKRANAVAEYLISHGVAKSRLVVRGMGEFHQHNAYCSRRVEVSINITVER